jgi:hypothetical protein
VNKQRSYRFHMEMFTSKKLMRSIMLRSDIDLQLWKNLTLRWKLIVLGNHRKYKNSKRANVIMK